MVLSLQRWDGKVAVVTGASSGIGAAIAKQLTENGIQVVGFARRVERIEELSKSLKGAKGKLYALKCDMRNEEDILECFQWVKKNVGPVSILINNAGSNKDHDLCDADSETLRTVVDVNLIGLCIATREAIQDMKKNHIDGHIININSIVGHFVYDIPGFGIYTAAKHGVTAATESVRRELNRTASRIKITSVSPGLVATEFFQEMYSHDSQCKLDGPELSSEDIADAVLYALSTAPHVLVKEITVKPVGEVF